MTKQDLKELLDAIRQSGELAEDTRNFTVLCGESIAECGELEAEAGDFEEV